MTEKIVTEKSLKSYACSVGSHDSPEKGMCVMELVAYMAGEPHSDSPACACPTIATFCRRLNDRGPQWVRDELRDRTFKILGSKKDLKTQVARAKIFADGVQGIEKTSGDESYRVVLRALDAALAV